MRAKPRIVLVAIGIATVIGCAGSKAPGPAVYGYAVRPARVDPVAADRAPRVYWRGSWARLVGGHWLYPGGDGWVTFVDEPPELARHRDSLGTEQTTTDVPSPRGPTLRQTPGAGLGNQE